MSKKQARQNQLFLGLCAGLRDLAAGFANVPGARVVLRQAATERIAAAVSMRAVQG